MRKISVNQALNDLIDDRRAERSSSGQVVMGRMKEEPGGELVVDISKIRVMRGLNILAESLIKSLIEKSVFGHCDVMAEQRVDPDLQPELHAAGVRNVSFFARLTVAESLPYFNETAGYQIRYIFNAIQNDEIYAELFPSTNLNSRGVLFPFHRVDSHDKTGFFYLVEYVPAGHFLRITLESAQDPRLRLSRIPHRVIDYIDLIHTRVDIPSTASSIAQGVMDACLSQKSAYTAAKAHFGDFVSFLNKAGLTDLEVLTFSWPTELIKKAPTMGMLVLNTHVIRILYLLGDSSLIAQLAQGQTIRLEDDGFSCFLDLSQRNRCLNLALLAPRIKSGLPECLVRMPAVMGCVADNSSVFRNTRVLLIHHLTSEVLGCIQALVNMGAQSIDTLWVKYAGAVEPYAKEIMCSLPENIFRFHGLTPVLEPDGLQYSFLLSEEYSVIKDLEPLAGTLGATSMRFYEAMRALAGHLMLHIAMTCRQNGETFVIIEDGGYIAPAINRLCLEQRTLAFAADFFHFPASFLSEEDLARPFQQWLYPVLTGSVEHTRNGYDALKGVRTEFGKLAFPSTSIAISNFKVNCESREVVYSCLNAVESIMNHMGFALSGRSVLVLGAQGALGRKSMEILSQRVGSANLYGVDLVRPVNDPDWTYASDPESLSRKSLKQIDLVFGVVGASICKPEWIEQLVLATEKQHLFFASGSTKTVEFAQLTEWLLEQLRSPRPLSNGEIPRVKLSEILDPKTGIHQGRSACLHFGSKTVHLHLLADLMPVNFLYYGVPSETMNQVMRELLEMSSLLVKRHSENSPLPGDLLALDHEIQKTE